MDSHSPPTIVCLIDLVESFPLLYTCIHVLSISARPYPIHGSLCSGSPNPDPQHLNSDRPKAKPDKGPISYAHQNPTPHSKPQHTHSKPQQPSLHHNHSTYPKYPTPNIHTIQNPHLGRVHSSPLDFDRTKNITVYPAPSTLVIQIIAAETQKAEIRLLTTAELFMLGWK